MTCGGFGTYEEVTAVEIGGKVRYIDSCIAPIVHALNDGGVETSMSCCGHGLLPGLISLGDGRELLVFQTRELAEQVIREWMTRDDMPLLQGNLDIEAKVIADMESRLSYLKNKHEGRLKRFAEGTPKECEK